MSSKSLNYRHTLYACYTGYIVQALSINLPPLLFVTFQREFGISLEKISLLITINFAIQILVDLLATRYADRIGYRAGAVAAHVLATLGFIGMGCLPYWLPDPYSGLLIATGFLAIGGGLTEVIISPVVESLPGDEKTGAMSLLHSFYCWGQVGVVLLSTVFFVIFGTARWRVLPLIWAVVPALNTVLFARVPLCTLVEDQERLPLRRLFSLRVFWILMVLMLCSGAAEQAVAQWASLFAETGLGVSKTVGDLLGPCAFALLMGCARLYFGRNSARLELHRALLLSGCGCIAGYLLIMLSPVPLLSLVGCALCGLSVGILWPGTLSLGARTCPTAGTAMFALLALCGDLGCTAGPGLVGTVSNRLQAAGQPLSRALKSGMGAALVFPVLLMAGVLLMRRRTTAHQQDEN